MGPALAVKASLGRVFGLSIVSSLCLGGVCVGWFALKRHRETFPPPFTGFFATFGLTRGPEPQAAPLSGLAWEGCSDCPLRVLDVLVGPKVAKNPVKGGGK